MMDPDRNPYTSLAEELVTHFIGRNIIYYPRLSSTMDAARTEAGRGSPEGTVIIAGEQTGGRGRLQRTWLTPPGNIALSIILYPTLASLPYLVMVASLAVVRAIDKTTSLKPLIKWPNDILINGKKVCGILIENKVRTGEVAFAIVGIGINVGLRPENAADISTTATSLSSASVREVSLRLIAKYLFEEFERLYLQLPDGGDIFTAWRDRLVTLGKSVSAPWGNNDITGIAESVDETGALLIRQSDNTLIRVVAGDVRLDR